jgi:hypothetical protein
MDSINYECRRQKKFQLQLENEGFSCVDDPADIYKYIGTVKTVECYCEGYTPKLLVKLYPVHLDREASPEKFWLVPLWQIVRYSYIVPSPGSNFSADYVIGCRKISSLGYVPSLRLPLQ